VTEEEQVEAKVEVKQSRCTTTTSRRVLVEN